MQKVKKKMRKLTTEERKHLITRTFVENTIEYTAYNFSTNSLETHNVTIGGKFDSIDDIRKYVISRYNTMECAINPISITSDTIKTREVRRAMFDYDFIRNSFLMDDENQTDEC